MLKKFIQIFIFAGYWLCFVPWLVIILNRHHVINPVVVMDYFIQYTTLLFVLIVVYWLVNVIIDHYYTSYQIKKKVRKITIQQQLERLERGEIDINEAQNIRTFIKASKPKSPKSKRSVRGKKPKPQEMKVLSDEGKKIPKSPLVATKNVKDGELRSKAPPIPISTDLPLASELPAYSDEMSLLAR